MDNNGTFNLPDCRDHIPWMGGVVPTPGYTTPGQLPNLKGSVGTHNHSLANIDGVLFKAGGFGSSAGLSGVGSFANVADFDASRYNSIYSDVNVLVIPSCLLVGGYVIKYI